MQHMNFGPLHQTIQNKYTHFLSTNKTFSRRTKDLYFEEKDSYYHVKHYQSVPSDITCEKINIMWVIMWNL